MYYTIYKITNIINQKIYIGKHKTKNLNDEYMGSGKLIKRAIEKYGIKNFKKEILFVFESEMEANNKEKELVEIGNHTYNICPGGQGGFGYINDNKLCDYYLGRKNANITILEKYGVQNPSQIEYNRKKSSLRFKKMHNLGIIKNYDWTGRKHKQETKDKISEANKIACKGKRNSQYGTIWITDGLNNRKIKKESYIPEGWYRGRKLPG